MSTRYLGDDEKAATLAEWHELLGERASEPWAPGDPDPDMIPWCEKINALSGTCTLQSCAGHGPDEGGYRSSGRLWLRLGEHEAHRFRERVFELVTHSSMERISIIYQPWGSEVVEIDFRGNADGEGQLEQSMRAILSFLESL